MTICSSVKYGTQIDKYTDRQIDKIFLISISMWFHRRKAFT